MKTKIQFTDSYSGRAINIVINLTDGEKEYYLREDGRGFNTCEVVYNYKAQKYEVLNVDTEIGNKEITIL